VTFFGSSNVHMRIRPAIGNTEVLLGFVAMEVGLSAVMLMILNGCLVYANFTPCG